MNQELRYRVNAELKNEYDNFVKEKYGYKRGKCGKSIEKIMKLELTLHGREKYQDDPDVIALMDKVKENPKINSKSSSNINATIEERLERKLEEKLEEIFAQFEKKARRESSKRHGLADFKKQFQMAFHDYNQVSRKDLEHFIMNNAEIVDSRSIRSRIQYLESNGVIQPYAPNVYNLNI